MNKATIRLLVIFLVVLLGSGLLVYLVLERSSRSRVAVDRPAVIATQPDAAESPAETPTPATGSNPLAEIFGSGTASTSPDADAELTASNIFLKFLIASILAAFLAFRWRSGVTITKRNPYVAQTQILLAVVAAAMMMVVGDSAARAFGIFAAASLVRFRTNIRDPKETTVLLICLGVGLACGVGRHELAAILTVFSLLTLWTLEHFESGQIFRTMEVSVGTRNLEHTHQAVKKLFAEHGFNSEVRQLNSEREGDDGKIVYQLNLGATVSTDRLTEEILASDPQNISSLEWDQKKSSTYIYR